MADEPRTLGFGVTYDMVAAQTACGQLLTLTSHRGNNEIPPHRHANDYICIVLSGGFDEVQGNRCVERRSGALFAHRAGETHHDRFGPRGAMCLNLHLAAGDERAVGIDGPCSAAAKVAASRLAFELASSSREELAMVALAAEIMGEIGCPGADKAEPSGNWIRSVVAAIVDQPGRRWTLGELSGLAGRHPIHVAQAFRAKTGISLGAFQRLRRLTALSLALRRGRTPLAALAAEFGYCDQSHMNSEFRRAFGLSPGRYRRELH